jgi:hypothetical protein
MGRVYLNISYRLLSSFIPRVSIPAFGANCRERNSYPLIQLPQPWAGGTITSAEQACLALLCIAPTRSETPKLLAPSTRWNKSINDLPGRLDRLLTNRPLWERFADFARVVSNQERKRIDLTAYSFTAPVALLLDNHRGLP